MSNRPWMPLYVADFIADTAHMNAAETGAYIALICHYWTTGKPLPDDDKRLARIAAMTETEWEAARAMLERFFTVDGGLWRHERVEAELNTPRRAFPFGSGIRRDDPRWCPEWRALREAVFTRDDYTCAYCGQRGGRLECDHITPVSRGGTNDMANLTTSCLTCNRQKGGKTLEEWMGRAQ